MCLTELKSRCWQDHDPSADLRGEHISLPQLPEASTFSGGGPTSTFQISNVGLSPSHTATSLFLICLPLHFLSTFVITVGPQG